MVDEKFVKAGGSVWKHVVVGYSKCNTFETSWRSGLEGKKKALQQTIREKISGCDVDVPVLALGGGEIEPPPPSQDEHDGLEKLWDFLAEADKLDTSQLQPFEGLDKKWEKMIEAKELAEQRAKAALIYVAVLLKLFVLCASLFWRHMMLPTWLSVLMFNFPGLWDEALILAAFVYWIGPKDVTYSLKHAYVTWVMPKVQPYIDEYLGPAAAGKAKAE